MLCTHPGGTAPPGAVAALWKMRWRASARRWGGGALQVGAGDGVTETGFGFGPVGLEFGVDEVIEDLAHLSALQRREEPGEFPRAVPGVLTQVGVAVVVGAFVGRLWAVLIDQAFPLAGGGLELACRQVVGVAEEFVLAGLHGRCHPLVGMHPAQQVHLIRADLTVLPGRFEVGKVAAGA
nr:hypothetical protein [Candidatus Microthrix sp.]